MKRPSKKQTDDALQPPTPDLNAKELTKWELKVHYVLGAALIALLAGFLVFGGTAAIRDSVPTRVFTAEELRKHDGSDPSLPLLLAIFGNVYDVSSGERHYAKGASYNFFTGRDGTRAFVTGKFDDEGLVPDINGLSPSQVLDIQEWQDMYDKDYKFVGRLAGYYFDDDGQPTAVHAAAMKMIEEGERLRAEGKNLKETFPPCNIRGAPNTATVVWCTKKSGGIQREWVGVPRELYHPRESGKRCACISDDLLASAAGMIKEYPDCPPSSTECKMPIPSS